MSIGFSFGVNAAGSGKQLKALSRLVGLPLFWPSRSRVPEHAPRLCQSLAGGACLALRTSLLETLNNGVRSVVYRACPSGLVCFAIRSADSLVQHSRVMGCARLSSIQTSIDYKNSDVAALWREVPETTEATLENLASACPALLLEDDTDAMSVENRVCSLLGQAFETTVANDLHSLISQVSALTARVFLANAVVVRVRDCSPEKAVILAYCSYSRKAGEGSGGRASDAAFSFAEGEEAVSLVVKIYPSHFILPAVTTDTLSIQVSMCFMEERKISRVDAAVINSYWNLLNRAVRQLERKEASESNEPTKLYGFIRGLAGSVDTLDVYNKAAVSLSKVSGASICAVLVNDGFGPYFQLKSSVGMSDEASEQLASYKLDENMVDHSVTRLLLSGQPALVTSDSYAGPAVHDLLALLGVEHCLLIPFCDGGSLLGVAALAGLEVSVLSKDSLVWPIMVLAVQIAASLSRITLTEKLDDNLSRAEFINDLVRQLSTTLSLRRLLHRLGLSLLPVFDGCKLLAVSLNESCNGVCTYTSRRFPLPLFTALMNRVRASFGKTEEISSVGYCSSDKRFANTPVGIALQCAGLNGLAVASLMRWQTGVSRVAGALVVCAPLGFEFTQERLDLLDSITSHFASFVDNARLHGNLNSRMNILEKLRSVGEASQSSLHPYYVHNQVARRVMEVTNAATCSLRLLDYRGRLELKAVKGVSPSSVPKMIAATGIFHRVMQTRRVEGMQYSASSSESFPSWMPNLGLISMLCAPVFYRDRVLGVLIVAFKRSLFATTNAMELLGELGAQVGIAVENAGVFESKQRISRLLQQALVPSEGFHFPNLNVGCCYVASRELSGDYFDIIPLGDEKYGIVMTDVSGKGLPAAEEALKIKFVVRSLALGGASPSEVLKALNAHMLEDANSLQATSFYCVLDVAKREIICSRGGHESALVFGGGIEPRWVEPDGPILGAIPDIEITEETVALPVGTRFLLYTDGIVEAQHHDSSNHVELFGQEGLLEVINAYSNSSEYSCQRVVDEVYDAASNFAHGRLTDDVSLLLIEIA